MLNLLSPIPPAKTGTANYFRLMLNELLPVRNGLDITIFVDGSYDAPSCFMDIPVRHIRDFAPDTCDVNLLAIANNEFHQYILHLYLRDDFAHYQNIAILHDIQIAQNLRGLYHNAEYEISSKSFEQCFADEFPATGNQSPFSRCLMNGHLYSILEFTTMGLGHVIRKSNHLFVHSYYARNKIKLESGLQECDVPPISVVAHPQELYAMELSQSASSNLFTIGCFGWIGKYKRIHSIIEAYAKLCSSWQEFRQRSRVVIAGQLPDPRHFDPRTLAYQLGVDDKIEFTGFLNHEDFLRKLGEVNLQFNLRYPSCGETSGTLHVGRSLLRNTVLTSYQSFREEAASYHVSADPDFEVAEIVSIMNDAFANWMAPVHPANRKQEGLRKSHLGQQLRELL
jgi:glycosyltransferase involved in cell wall biosynthesis